MYYNVSNPTPEQKQAWSLLSWAEMCEENPNFERISKSLSKTHRLTSNVQFSHQAYVSLSSFNDMDARMVLKDVIDLTFNPSPRGVKNHPRYPLARIVKSKYPFKGYHFNIDFEVTPSGQLEVKEIFIDFDRFTINMHKLDQPNMLYHVEQREPVQYNGPTTQSNIDKARGSWTVREAVTSIKTEKAAVNGMMNNLQAAGGLMGIHVQNAYSKDVVNEYTLFHNPTENVVFDLAECLWDKGITKPSHNAQHLTAVLHHSKLQGRKIEWVVHSQGAIIFCRALEYYRRTYSGDLSNHSVVIHASGASVSRLKKAAAALQLKVVKTRNNPLDLVPNLSNHRSLLARSLFFGKHVINSDHHNGLSPHTLPYLGITMYRDQLRMAGYHKDADRVQRFIDKRNAKRAARRKQLG